jgi:hypothetical protein
MVTVAGGRVAETWVKNDAMTMMAQLGALPAAGALAREDGDSPDRSRAAILRRHDWEP